ncbi:MULTISPECIES: hypothetical protein [unclassified Arthrobacter]|uniref:hypothetical protein n=1 Tax=unclassified Arthrobacter TaxID=235627 RepID=UPI00159D6C7C|nr:MULTISPECIES: hypothetical protein [unclassified Arthrobacter]MCQ9165981.1 hypothetical protein [Arthrobacter sp. STN4]NVM98691.1 hypothetical protein [Arthrobacter sp. SDTb3-6]
MRTLELVRACYGACELIWPSGVYRVLSGGPPPKGAVTIVRVLGARHVAQAALLAGADRLAAPHGLHRVFSLVDAAHCATMVALAAGSRRLRRPARRDAVIAGSFALLENR